MRPKKVILFVSENEQDLSIARFLLVTHGYAVLSAANEVAVEAFVNGRLNFPGIAAAVGRTMDRHQVVPHPTLEQILEADAWARAETAR